MPITCKPAANRCRRQSRRKRITPSVRSGRGPLGRTIGISFGQGELRSSDQEVVLRRLHQLALNAEHDFILRAHELRLDPRTVLLEQLLCKRREKRQYVEEWSLLLRRSGG